jgi:hypothetical protein
VRWWCFVSLHKTLAVWHSPTPWLQISASPFRSPRTFETRLYHGAAACLLDASGIRVIVCVVGELGKQTDETILHSGELAHAKPVGLPQICDIVVEDILVREPVHLEEDRIPGLLEGKTVLITGAGAP